MEISGEVRELAPQASSRLWFGFLIEAALGVLIGALALRGNSAGVVLGISFILLGAAFPVTYWLWLRNTRLLVGPGVVGYQNLYGRRSVWSTSDVARTVQTEIVYNAPKSGRQPKKALLLMARDGRCLLRVRSANWGEDAIGTFAAATGCASEYLGYYTSGQAAKEFPGSVGFIYAHIVWTALVAVAIVLVLGALMEWLLLTSR